MTKRKVIPSLRSLADQERATAKKARASWQMFTIMAEFIEATEYLSEIRPAVSIYGSARLKPNSPYYKLATQIARKLSDAGFAVISGDPFDNSLGFLFPPPEGTTRFPPNDPIVTHLSIAQAHMRARPRPSA